MSEGPYSRVYWSILSDEKFDGIRDDSRLLGAWTLLLVVADMAYPSPAFVPPTVTKASVAALVQAELIDLLPGHRYTVHGLDAERKRRSDAARVGGLASGRSRKSADPVERPLNDRSATVEQSVDESKAKAEDESKTSTRQAETEAQRVVPDPADVLWNLSGRYPTDKALSWVDDMTSSYGPEPTIRAIANAHLQDRNPSTLLSRTQDILRAEARALSLKEQATVRQALKDRRAAPRADIDPNELNERIQRILRGEAA